MKKIILALFVFGMCSVTFAGEIIQGQAAGVGIPVCGCSSLN